MDSGEERAGVKAVRPIEQARGIDRLKCLGVGVLALTVCAVLRPGHAADDPRVTVEAVREVPLVNRLELSGTVTSRRVSQLSSEVPGLISVVHHDAGAKVSAGDVLIELDPVLQEIARDQIAAQIMEAKAQLADAERRLRIAENLAERAHGPQNTVDTVKTEIVVRRAAIERLTAERRAAEERLVRHKIKAPFAGTVSRKMAEAGQWVVPGTPVTELVELEGLRVEFPVPQQYFGRIEDGVDISFSFDAMPDLTFPARIDAVIPVADSSARTFTLRAVPVNDAITLAPGMSARATIGLKTGTAGLVVSRDALLRQPDGRITVWLVEPNGSAHRVRERRVEIGISFDGLTEIRSGLKKGDRVVVRGNESLTEGQSVELAS